MEINKVTIEKSRQVIYKVPFDMLPTLLGAREDSKVLSAVVTTRNPLAVYQSPGQSYWVPPASEWLIQITIEEPA